MSFKGTTNIQYDEYVINNHYYKNIDLGNKPKCRTRKDKNSRVGNCEKKSQNIKLMIHIGTLYTTLFNN